MDKLNTLPFEPWIRYVSQFTENTLDRMQSAVNDIEEENYSPERFISDGVRFWLDVTVGWWTAMQASALKPTPIVFLPMLSNDEAPRATMPVTIAQNAEIKTTQLVSIGGPGNSQIRDGADAPCTDRLEVSRGDKPGHITVTYHNVPNIKGEARAQLLTPGLYQSLIHADQKLVAIVQLLVEE